MDAQDVENVQVKPKKRTPHPENWKRNLRKDNRATGLGYIQHYNMNIMPPRQRTNVECRHNCPNLMTTEEKDEVFRRFNALANHEKQNIYLQGCIGDSGQQKCRIKCIGRSVSVCIKFFVGLHGIKVSRLRRKVLQPIVPIQDLRGKHGHQKKTSEEILNIVRAYLQNLPARESHYSILVNPHRKYIDAKFTVKKLYNTLISDENNILTNESLKLWQFRKIYNYEFNIGIGLPRSDVCETCETFHCEIARARLNGNMEQMQAIKNNQRSHWEEADLFFKKMSKDRPEFNDPSYGFYCFDYEKNLQFPITNIGKEFFLRQMWLFNFTIHNIKTGDSYMFLYTENFGRKGSNETISFLKHFIEQLIPEEVQHLRLFSDNSGGQNKNRFVFADLQSLYLERFASVEMVLPLPGHSRMQVDGDFSLIEKRKRREDKIHCPSDWVNVIRTARDKNPFRILFANYPVTNNLLQDGTPIVTIFGYKSSLEQITLPAHGINQVRQIKFQRGIFHLTISKSLNQEPAEVYQILKHFVSPDILLNTVHNTQPAYLGYLPISQEKFENVSYLLSKFYRPPENIFYSSVFARPGEETNQQRIMREVMMEYPEEIDISFLE